MTLSLILLLCFLKLADWLNSSNVGDAKRVDYTIYLLVVRGGNCQSHSCVRNCRRTSLYLQTFHVKPRDIRLCESVLRMRVDELAWKLRWGLASQDGRMHVSDEVGELAGEFSSRSIP